MLSSELAKNAFIVIVAALLPVYAFGAASELPTKPVEIHLESEVKVGGDQVVLGDVATIYAKSMKDFKALSGLVISKIPEDKQEVNLPASYLEARIRAALPEGMVFTLHAPALIRFQLERFGLTTQDFAAEVVRLARASGKVPLNAEVEVIPISGMDQLKGLNLSKVRIEPQGEMEKWKGDLSFKVTRTDDNGKSGPAWIRAKVRWFRDAWIAARQLGFSEQPSAQLFTKGRIETTNLLEEPVAGTSEELALLLKSSKLRRPISANAPLLPGALERRPDAGPGSLLRVVFISESGVRVGADAALISAGSIGGDVKARLRSSKKIVTGKLVSQGVVEVSL